MKWHLRGWGTAGLLAFLMMVSAVRAQEFPRDFDSLTFTSTVIVEGQVVGDDAVGKTKAPGLNVKVTVSYKGEVKVGDVIQVISLDAYRKASDAPLDLGEHLLLFLTRGLSPLTGRPAGNRPFLAMPAPPPPVPTDGYTVAPGGILLIDGNQARHFVRAPGKEPLFRVGSYDPPPGYRTLADFRSKLIPSLNRTNEVARHLNESPIEPQAPWLLEFLRSKRFNPANPDYVANAVVEHLQKVHDLAALDGLADFEPNGWGFTLVGPFATSDGWRYLVGKLTDDKVSMERKLRYARLLNWALGHGFMVKKVDGKKTARPMKGSLEEYIAMLGRVAGLALEHRKDEALCLALTQDACKGVLKLGGDSGNEWAEEVKVLEEVQVPAEAKAALAPLRELYAVTTSKRMKYEIEMTLAKISRADFDQLGCKSGPIISRVRPNAGPGGKALGVDGKIHCLIDWRKLDKMEVHECRLVLENLETHRSLAFPTDHEDKLRDLVESHYFHSTALPKEFPHGKCRIHLEFVKDDKVISVSPTLEAEL